MSFPGSAFIIMLCKGMLSSVRPACKLLLYHCCSSTLFHFTALQYQHVEDTSSHYFYDIIQQRGSPEDLRVCKQCANKWLEAKGSFD
eukprot:scaffold84059_cov19-Tisochrysis_lutea.AAC.1